MGRRSRVFIIAEAGINHNGDIKLAKEMIDAASYAGADAVKFQTFLAEKTAARHAEKSDYQKLTGRKKENQQSMLLRYQLGRSAHEKLYSYCCKKNIMFLSSPFDIESVDLLDSLGLEIFKIPSGEINNMPYLRKIAGLRKEVILSTGMSDMTDIGSALEVLESFGTDKSQITVLHCNSAYPTPLEDVNLKAMLTIRDFFDVDIGYSDHTLGIEIPIAAVALGAKVIEKHFTLNKGMPGPDHPASLEPPELRAMVKAVRNVERSLGDGTKKPSLSEMKNRDAARKSIVAARNIKKGEVFSGDNIAVKRPGTGISPMQWDDLLGQKAVRDFQKDEFISFA